MRENIVREKSFKFAIKIVKLYQNLCTEKNEFVLSRQVLRSGTSIGALVRESEYAQSKKDFINKLSIALKEANETEYWLMLLKDSDYLNDKKYQSIQPDITELLKLLIAIVNTSKNR